MTKLTKIVSCILSSAFLAAAGAGCNGYNRPNSGGELPAQDYTVDFNLPATTSAEIKVIIPDNETERKLMNALIEGFNQKYPNIKVTMNFLTIDSYNSTVTKQYSAKVLADVIWTNSSNYYFLVSNGYALNLDHFTEQAEKAGEFDYDADFTEDFRSMGLFGGTRYAVPRSADSVVTFYNKNILTAAGVDLKPETTLVKNGWSWEDFLTVCGQVREYYDKKSDSNFIP
ncbi:MAG: ABC transporter substrate-binding protein [Christensenellaceae bacterium]